MFLLKFIRRLPQSMMTSGDCGTGVTIRYEEPDSSGTFTGDVECTLA